MKSFTFLAAFAAMAIANAECDNEALRDCQEKGLLELREAVDDLVEAEDPDVDKEDLCDIAQELIDGITDCVIEADCANFDEETGDSKVLEFICGVAVPIAAKLECEEEILCNSAPGVGVALALTVAALAASN